MRESGDMALDLHVLEKRRHARLLYQIGDAQYARLYKAFALYQERTRVFIDPYADTVIGKRIEPLLQALRDSLKGEDQIPVKVEVLLLIDVLTKAQQENLAVIFVGD